MLNTFHSNHNKVMLTRNQQTRQKSTIQFLFSLFYESFQMKKISRSCDAIIKSKQNIPLIKVRVFIEIIKYREQTEYDTTDFNISELPFSIPINGDVFN
jgi:hypothetical protein